LCFGGGGGGVVEPPHPPGTPLKRCYSIELLKFYVLKVVSASLMLKKYVANIHETRKRWVVVGRV
jgi:hypothetical protein